MKLVWALLIAAAFCSSEAARIIGGEPTTIEDYPSIVQVDSYNEQVWSQSCAGSIITSRYILSAAHCFYGESYDINNRRIRAGATERNAGGVIVGLERVVIHPSYGIYGYEGDIALVQLISSLEYSSTIQNVAIAPQDYELPNDLPVTAAGWGATSEGGSASPVLRDVTMNTIDRELCTDRYINTDPPSTVTDNMICAGILVEGGKDAVSGDYGGPLYYDGILFGILSWGEGRGDPFYASVSTRVSAYTNWILVNAV